MSIVNNVEKLLKSGWKEEDNYNEAVKLYKNKKAVGNAFIFRILIITNCVSGLTSINMNT